MSHYKNDPYWITARFGECEECRAPLKEKRAFYYPKGKHIYCEDCGGLRAAEFTAAVQDEDFYNSQY
jgi:hypothetical protein